MWRCITQNARGLWERREAARNQENQRILLTRWEVPVAKLGAATTTERHSLTTGANCAKARRHEDDAMLEE